MGTDNMRTIREMTFDDIDPVMEIERACFTTPWTAEGFLSFMLREGTVFLVAEEDGEILGQCGFVSAADEADITNVAVAPKARSRGPLKVWKTAVAMTARVISRAVEPPRMRLARSLSPSPMAMAARGAPPCPARPASAAMNMVMGKQTPRPVRARSPLAPM